SVGNRLSKNIDVKSNADGLESGFYQYFYDDDNRLVQEVLAKGTGNGLGKGHGGGHGNGGGHGWGNGGQITDFLYDLNGNLLEERKDNAVSRFGYDVMDNLVYASIPGKVPVAYTFNGDGMRTAQYTGRANGNGHGNGKGRWNASGRGQNMGCGSGCGQADSFFECFRWDMERSFAYSGPEVIAEFDGRDKLDQAFTYGPGIDNLISVTRAKGNPRTRTSYALSDVLGSVRKILGQRGKTMNSYSYTPFGEAFNVHEAVVQPFRYTGRRWDENVGKQWSRTRHYDPRRGRFSQADKWKFAIINSVIHHPYAYVTNNPIKWTDPFGLLRTILLNIKLMYSNTLFDQFLQSQIDVANEIYKAADVEFKIANIDKSDRKNEVYRFETLQTDLFATDRMDNAINVYFVRSILDKKSQAISGVTSAPSAGLDKTGIAITTKGFSTKESLAHELGHFFIDLPNFGDEHSGRKPGDLMYYSSDKIGRTLYPDEIKRIQENAKKFIDINCELHP
ncbi:MAG: hypothetical protein CVV64_20550, partial [Candidatus Wallbacteria bacterium HGW-Wallbacteria-1]